MLTHLITLVLFAMACAGAVKAVRRRKQRLARDLRYVRILPSMHSIPEESREHSRKEGRSEVLMDA